MVLSNKTYDILKWVTILGYPIYELIKNTYEAIITGDPMAITYAVISGIMAIIGIILKNSCNNYNNAQFGSVAVVSKEDVTETVDESEYEGTTDED